MSGIVAYKISKKMNAQLKDVKRGLTEWDTALAHFTGFMDAMVSTGFCTREESGMFITEFTRLLLEPVIIG